MACRVCGVCHLDMDSSERVDCYSEGKAHQFGKTRSEKKMLLDEGGGKIGKDNTSQCATVTIYIQSMLCHSC